VRKTKTKADEMLKAFTVKMQKTENLFPSAAEVEVDDLG